MNTYKEISAMIPDVSVMVANHHHYLAHIHSGKADELLDEHVKRVNANAQLLVEKHGLDPLIDGMISDVVEPVMFFVHKEEVRFWIKRLFVDTGIFHDFGKVNENFQVDRMQNNKFLKNKKLTINPPYGHSYLGAYLFLSYHLDGIIKSDLNDEEKNALVIFSFFFSHVVDRHHRSNLEDVTDRYFFKHYSGRFDELKHYLEVFDFSINRTLFESFLNNIGIIWNEIEEEYIIHFPLFALIKLSSSLLTTADYLATHEYATGKQVTDFGIFENRTRVREVITHLRNYKHNRDVYAGLEQFEFKSPQEKSNINLNRLRQEMAVELIQTIREHRDKRLFYLEAPTGGGKTNMSMLALSELLEMDDRIKNVFYVFPFTTLITQTFQALKESFGLTTDELVELHSKAPLQRKDREELDGDYGDKRQDFIDNLFALFPVTLLSHVKFFDILKTNRKESNYLLHRLANSVVVIDELQSYNPKIWDKMLYFISQYARCFNIRFILMSATLPKIGSLDIKQSHSESFVDLLPHSRDYMKNPNFAGRVNFRFDLFEKEELSLTELAEIVVEKSDCYRLDSPSDSVHTIIEFIFKRSASEFLKEIQVLSHPFDEIFVLSGTILDSRRRKIINFIKNKDNRSKNILLITTQVVEAGVDIDMDLGFKNISLLDSDEQLAGRVNRNALKGHAEVYLFRYNNASLLYGGDERYKVTRDKNKISLADYQRILLQKDFAELYRLVFKNIDGWNSLGMVVNFPSGFIRKGIQSLNYPYIDEQFQIIEGRNASVFVPLDLPVEIEASTSGEMEPVFLKEEIEFLQCFGVTPRDNRISGREVWQVYEELIHSRGKGFNLEEKVNFKILQVILSKFTFSLLFHSRDYKELLAGLGLEKYGYLYFSLWNNEGTHGVPYDYESGLNNEAFADISFI